MLGFTLPTANALGPAALAQPFHPGQPPCCSPFLARWHLQPGSSRASPSAESHRLDAGAGSDPQGRGWWHNPDTPTPQEAAPLDPGYCSSHAQQASVATWRVGQGTSLSFPLQMTAMVVPAEDEDGRPRPSHTLEPRISPVPLSARTPPTPGSAAVLAGTWRGQSEAQGRR